MLRIEVKGKWRGFGEFKLNFCYGGAASVDDKVGAKGTNLSTYAGVAVANEPVFFGSDNQHDETSFHFRA